MSPPPNLLRGRVNGRASSEYENAPRDLCATLSNCVWFDFRDRSPASDRATQFQDNSPFSKRSQQRKVFVGKVNSSERVSCLPVSPTTLYQHYLNSSVAFRSFIAGNRSCRCNTQIHLRCAHSTARPRSSYYFLIASSLVAEPYSS